MKYKFSIVIGACVLVGIVILLQVSYFSNPSLDKYSQTITVIYQPAKIDKIRHEISYVPTKLASEHFMDYPQIQTLFDVALMPRKNLIDDDSKIDTFFYEQGTNLYRISQPGPSTIRTDFFMTTFNQNEYIHWIETELIGIPIYESNEMHFVEYKNEIFILTFEDVKEID